MFRTIVSTSIYLLCATFMGTAVLAANPSVQGFVRDGKTGEPLVGASVMLVDTRMGAATDKDGKYVIQNVLPGKYTIRVSYIGYEEWKSVLTVAGEDIQLDFKLKPVGVMGEEVVVTGQAAGQNAAINQQLSSNQIVNVVSAARIQELPDANAAESIGRLPGVLVLRNGGEGNQIVVRGLQPKYNEIMIDGVQMSSSDPFDRSTDMSMISSNILEGIEVSKTVTPDMDANVLGGTVNFEMREAKVSQSGVPHLSVLLQGGYNNLSDAYNKLNNYKYVGSVDDRYFEEKLGVFAQVDVERKNLTSNELGASYNHLGNSTTQYITTGLTLHDIPRDRQRFNGALNIDYRLPDGKIKLTNLISSGNTVTQDRNESFDITSNTINYALSNSKSTLTTMVNALNFQQLISIFQVDANLSHAYSETKDPRDWTTTFLQTSAGINQFINKANVNPQDIPNAATYNVADTYLNTFASNSTFSRERALTGSLNLKTNVDVSDLINADIKFGGKYRYQLRSYNNDQYDGQSLISGSAVFLDSFINSYFSLPQTTQISMNNFIDDHFSYGKFLHGDYKMVAPLNSGMLTQMSDLLNRNVQYIADNNGAVSFGHDNLFSTTNNYSGHENQWAFYVMPVINIGPEINIITGVRYQNLQTVYTAARGIESVESWFAYNHYDTTVTQNHGYWLPDLAVKYKPLDWFDVRLSYTNTLAYPDYNAIIPRIDVASKSISWLNYQLLPSRSTNYDVSFSFYNNSIGLFTVCGYLKQITNLIYPWSFYVSGANALQYYPPGMRNGTTLPGTMNVSTFINDSYRINNYGVELDWQTHFWYLPLPFSGLVFSANYTHIFSKAQYPFTYVLSTGRTLTYIDSSFTDKLIDQPDNVLNLSLGFDYASFSVRVGMLYQSDIFTGPNFWPQLRAHTSAYRRWDFAAKQDLPWFGLQVFLDVNNITGARDMSVIQGGGVPTSEQDYGLTADLGLRWNF